MFQFRIWFLFFSAYIIYTPILTGQEIRAELQKTYHDKDSLVLTITLINVTDEALYLVGGVDVLTFEDYYPVSVNYGSFREELDARKRNQSIEKVGDIMDTIKLTMPTTNERFQLDNKGEQIDVFKTLTYLQEVYNNKRISTLVPIPPVDSVLVKSNFLDIDLYYFIQRENITINDGNFFYGQTIIFKAKEKKSFNINLSHLLLRKGTYELIFDFKTDNYHFKKETRFLRDFGFHRFKGRIRSNILRVVSS